MSDAEPPPAMEEATLTTPDVVLGEGYKDIEGQKDGRTCYGEGGDVIVADEFAGIVEDPNQPDVFKAKEPEEGVDVGGQTNVISAAVHVLTEVDAAVSSSTLVDDPMEVGMQTKEVSAAADDLIEVGAALVPSAQDHTAVAACLVNDDCNIVITGGVHRSDDQTVQEFGGDSLDADEVAPLVNDVQDDSARIDMDVAANDHVHAQDQESSQLDVATALLNEVETEIAEAGDHVVQDCTNMDMQIQTGDDKHVGTIADTATDEEGKHMGEDTMGRDGSEKHDGAVGVDVSDERVEMGRGGLSGDDNEQKEVATADEDRVEEEDMQVDAVSITGDMVEEGRIAVEYIAGEAVNGKDGIDVPEEKTPQIDKAGNDIPEEEGLQMGGAGLIGNKNGPKEAVIADYHGVEENTILMEAATTTNNDDDDDNKIVGEDVAEAVNDITGDGVPEQEAAHMDDDDDDEPPPLVAKKGGGRRKRGRPSSKVQAVVKPSVKGKDEEEVCFICFDGGDLVICDRRGCPKAYHPSCVNRDDDFFKSKGRWNCGWHICSNCQKPARHMCYTCTFSLCKACMKDAKFSCVRENKGFCATCMNTVMLIENREEAADPMEVDFDDKSSWWYLFKDYWLNLKTNLSLTVEEISAAKSQKSGELPDTNDEINSESSSGRHLENNTSKKRGRNRSKQAAIEQGSEGKETTGKSAKLGLSGIRDAQTSSGKKVRKLSRRSLSSQHSPKDSESVGTSTSSADEVSWASKELINFVAHARNGDKSVINQYDVQPLLLDYIKRNNLRDPRRKSQIICDSLLQSLFGKDRVGHFEMLKLLESHFPTSEVSPIDADENHGGVVDPDPSQDADGNSEASVVMSSEKRRKSRKYDLKHQPNIDDYAAIDNHNIGLMYLRRNLMEELIDDVDTFDEKVVGSFVRIRIPGTGQRQDIYRLVQIVGTGRSAEKYKSGKRTTDITLVILNLDKREAVTIDIISNQEFTEEECKRLRQSIKYGFIPRLTVGEVQEKAKVLQTLKVNDWIESEKMRLGHLRDRASDMGRRKELRECVEKLKLLSTPEERARRLNEEPEIHADPAMDPYYESPEEHIIITTLT
ncbi:Zinc finger CCCH domain-containing protein 19 [Zea mays]|uniref:Zinc finger CCCH domain-containing protein 19 n=1 Tax=Zea mays TaxID=4577 RepID=A0A1D6NBX9_MAIZE|nr:Zinc finger CCCH domain-containing protein 19 [Zea mays]